MYMTSHVSCDKGIYLAKNERSVLSMVDEQRAGESTKGRSRHVPQMLLTTLSGHPPYKVPVPECLLHRVESPESVALGQSGHD